MKCYYSAATEAHDPVFRLTHGSILRNAEQAERAHLLLDGLKQVGLTTEEPPRAPREAIEAVHTPRLLAFLENGWDEWQKLPGAGSEVVPNLNPQKATSTYPTSVVGKAGWHMGDTSCPIGEHSWTATLGAADCAVAAADAVLAGDMSAYALCRPPGHHSDTDTVAGHCLLNNSAIAVERLIAGGKKRIATLDIDVHHGNGTQAIFYERADVLTVSIHTDPAYYYPFYVGYAHETGSGGGVGTNLNIPLPATSGDDAWCAAIETALSRIADFGPDALVLPLGLDAHENDPLKGMQVSFDGFARAARLIRAAGYPTVLVQEGGYLSPDLTTSLASFMGGWLDKDLPAA